MKMQKAETLDCKCDSIFPPAISINHYKSGQTVMTPEQKTILDGYAELLMNNPQAHIEITGHTCDTGAKESNLRIGQRSADSAKDYLIEKGIAPSRIFTFSKGETEPLFPNTDEENRRKNRRLEIKLNK
jgi:outer membrane protein OmpA-like peptidoglycan-associated protein